MYPPAGNLAEYFNGSSSALVQQQDLQVGFAGWGVNACHFQTTGQEGNWQGERRFMRIA
jgi:hypothetical protein